jgi:3-hydroxyacyl-CoA dehydrogenase
LRSTGGDTQSNVANRLQAALAREVYYFVAEDILSAADVDAALGFGPGLRWGIMGNMMRNHLAAGRVASSTSSSNSRLRCRPRGNRSPRRR